MIPSGLLIFYICRLLLIGIGMYSILMGSTFFAGIAVVLIWISFAITEGYGL